MTKLLPFAIVVMVVLGLAQSLSAIDLDAELQKMLDSRKLMGMAVEISKNGSTIYKGNFGLRDFDRKLPVDNNTLFRMASLSKSMTSAGLMLLY